MEIELFKGEKSFTAELQTDPETGEIIGGEHLDLIVKRNPVGCIAYALRAKADAEMIDAQIKRLQALKTSVLNGSERAKESLKNLMQFTGTTRIESDDKTFKAVLSIGRDESVEVFDENQIPSDYMREIPATYSPDKTLIKKAIKDGLDVPGCKINSKDRLTLG